MAALVYTKGFFNFQFTCSATILSYNKLLTAAHCVQNTSSITLLLATLNTDEPYYSVDVSDDEIIIHDEYDRRSHSNNLAIIELKRPLKFSQKIGQVSMVDKASVRSIKTGTNVLMLGYMESNDPNRNYEDTHLRSISAKIADFSTCHGIYSGINKLENGRHFCLHNTYPKYAGGNRSLLE